jgi:hypothetical protein
LNIHPLESKKMTAGYIKVDRDIWTDPSFAEEAFCERMAWLWLMSEAAWQTRERRIGSQLYILQRGQLVASTRFIAEKWMWSHPTVRRFLLRLQEEKKILWDHEAAIGVITICNYDIIQNFRGFDEPAMKQPCSRDVPNQKKEKKKPVGTGPTAGRPKPVIEATNNARSSSDTVSAAAGFREQLLAEMRCTPSGEVRPGGKRIGTSDDMMIVDEWINVLHLSEEHILGVVRSVMGTKADGKPPNSFRYFSEAMGRFATKLHGRAKKPSLATSQQQVSREAKVRRVPNGPKPAAQEEKNDASEKPATAKAVDEILKDVGFKLGRRSSSAQHSNVESDEKAEASLTEAKSPNRLEVLPRDHPERIALENARNRSSLVQQARADADRISEVAQLAHDLQPAAKKRQLNASKK